MKVTFKTGSEANYGSTNGELFFASNTKQIMLNGIKYIPKKLSELTNDSGFISSITKSMVEGVLTGNITSHTHTQYLTSLPSRLSQYITAELDDGNGFGKLSSGSPFKTFVNSSYNDCMLITTAYSATWRGELALDYYSNNIAYRNNKNGTWNSWAMMLTTDNFNKYALPLSGGTLTGNLTCNGSYINMNGSSGTKGYRGYFNNSQSDRAAGSHIFQSDGFAYGTNATSIGLGSYAGIRNTDSDSGTYPYLHWQWMDCLQVKEVTSAGDVNCYGAILNNSGGTKNTAKFIVCVDGVCKSYDENKGDNDPTNQFLKFTNTDASCGRVVVFIADTDTLIFGGNTSHPRRMCNLKIGNMILGQGSRIADVASMSINKKTVYRLAVYWWSGELSNDYNITKATTAMVCTKVNNSNYNGASSYASGSYSVASGSHSVASGSYSVASGSYSVAKHEGSKMYALRGVSGNIYQTVLGRDNAETTGAVVVGWGSSDTSRKNIFVLDTNGNATFGSGGAASVTAATFNGNATTASKLATARTITIGSTYKYFDGSSDIEFKLSNIITQSDNINVGTINVAEQLTTKNITIGNHLSISSGVDIKGLTPSMIGAATASHTHSYIVTEGDNRSVATTPNDYSNNFVFKGLKFNSQIGSPTTDTYSYLLGLRGWYDSSGGQSHELAFNNSGIYRRQGATEWGNWCKLLDSENYNSYALPLSGGTLTGTLNMTGQQINAGSITVSDSISAGSISANSISCGNKDVSLSGHTHTFASLTDKPTTISGYGITDAFTKTETNTELGKYLPLTGGTLTGALTVPTLTATGKILLGDSSLSAMVGSIGIQRHDETGFIGFLKELNLDNSFNGVVIGWDGNYSLQGNSVRIDASTFTYKGNSVLHSGNLGYTSSGLSRAVQKDANGNLFIVAPSLFEQGISNNYPKNLRWTTETEGQLVYDTEETAGSTTMVEVGIPLAHGTSKGFLKSTSTVTNVTGYTPCPVVSGTPYYKLDAIELDYTDLGIVSGSIESNVPINTTIQQDGNLGYLLNYTVDNIPRLLTIALGSYCKYFFWLQQTDDENPIVAYYHCQFNDLWLVIDSPNMEVRISQGSF